MPSRPISGELAWKYKGGGDGDPKYLYLPIQSTVVVADGVVYGASRKAAAFALDAASGAEKWQSPNGAGNWFESSPIAAGNRVYIGSSAGSNLFALDRDAGFSAGSFNTQGYAWSTPVVDGDTVFIGSESTAGSSSGKAGVWAVALDRMGSPDLERWFFATPETLEPAGFNGVNSSPVLVERTLYFGGLDGVVYALDV